MTTNVSPSPRKDFWIEYFNEDIKAVSIMIGEIPAVYLNGVYTCHSTTEPVTRDRYYRELEKVLSEGDWDAFIEGKELIWNYEDEDENYRISFKNGYRATATITRDNNGIL